MASGDDLCEHLTLAVLARLLGRRGSIGRAGCRDLSRWALLVHRERMSFDPVAFRSDRLPTKHFDRRFSEENLAFWVPLLLKSAQITPGLEVLEVGCGTGGFARAIASAAPAQVTGLDRSARFLGFARQQPRPSVGTVRWVVGDAEQLPFAPLSFDRVLLSLVLHQLGNPRAGVVGAVRVLRGGGLVLVRTIAPEDVAGRVPQRFIPRMAAIDAARLPSVEAITAWLMQAGLAAVTVHRHLRNHRLVLAEVEHGLRTEASFRYGFLTSDELEEGVRRMRADAAQGDWIDPRPTYIIVGMKPPSAA
jgi:ubiquinone/menaquinone biosynthesis C-methylase UbiE